jgi:hypothetical protein
MPDSILARVPVVGGLGYVERVRRMPSSFTVTLQVESANRYFRHAIAVIVGGEKLGYVAPEIARGYYDGIRASAEPVRCSGRHGRQTDHDTSGVELLLDFRELAVTSRAEDAVQVDRS